MVTLCPRKARSWLFLYNKPQFCHNTSSLSATYLLPLLFTQVTKVQAYFLGKCCLHFFSNSNTKNLTDENLFNFYEFFLSISLEFYSKISTQIHLKLCLYFQFTTVLFRRYKPFPHIIRIKMRHQKILWLQQSHYYSEINI